MRVFWQEVTKVFMGASGALSNGTILARTGSASVAMAAHAMQRPVIVCCETLKFQDRVQLDSITYNELGDPHLLESVKDRPELDSLQNWSEEPQLGMPRTSVPSPFSAPVGNLCILFIFVQGPQKGEDSESSGSQE